MNGADALARWIDDKKNEAERLLAPEEAVLSGRFALYAFRRLLGFGLARSLAIFFHVVELTVLWDIFSAHAFVAALAMQNGMLVIESFFWGALEALRRRARELGPGSEAAGHVTQWIGIAWRVAFVAVALPAGWAAWDVVANEKTPPLLTVYAVVCGVRLAADVVVRTYYSGVFAHTRVYRPLWSLLVGPTLLVGVTVLLWRPLLGWSFPIATLAAAAASRLLLFVFTRRAYVRHRIPQPSFRLRRTPLQRSAVVRGLLAGAANATSRLGAVALLAAVIPSLVMLDSDEGGGVEPFAFALHLAAPLLFLASQWSFVFYHDYKRLESEEAALLARHLHARVVATAVVVGILAWALVVTMVLVFLSWSDARDVLIALLPLTVGLAIWAAVQLRGFARGDFVTQGVSAAAMIAALVAVISTTETRGPAWYLTLAVSPACAVALHVAIDRWRKAHVSGLVATFAAWRRARRSAGEVVVWRARCANHAARVATGIAARLDGRGAVFRRDDDVLWFERAPYSRREKWIVVGGGEIAELTRDAEDVALAAPELATLRDMHAKLFPGSFVVRVGRAAPAEFAALPQRVRQEIWHEGLRALRGGGSRSRFAVTPYAPDGTLEALFVASKPLDPESAAAWRALSRLPDHTTSSVRGR